MNSWFLRTQTYPHTGLSWAWGWIILWMVRKSPIGRANIIINIIWSHWINSVDICWPIVANWCRISKPSKVVLICADYNISKLSRPEIMVKSGMFLQAKQVDEFAGSWCCWCNGTWFHDVSGANSSTGIRRSWNLSVRFANWFASIDWLQGKKELLFLCKKWTSPPLIWYGKAMVSPWFPIETDQSVDLPSMRWTRNQWIYRLSQLADPCNNMTHTRYLSLSTGQNWIIVEDMPCFLVVSL